MILNNVKEKEEPRYNALIEGTRWGAVGSLLYFDYKRTNLDIPDNATALINRGRKYILYATTKDFQTVKKTNTHKDGLEAELNNADISPSSLSRGGYVRAIYLLDGRIFINELIVDDEDYLTRIPGEIKFIGKQLKKNLNTSLNY